MKKFLVRYEIQYQGFVLTGEEQDVEAYSQSEAESDTKERVLDNLVVFTTAEEEEEDE